MKSFVVINQMKLPSIVNLGLPTNLWLFRLPAVICHVTEALLGAIFNLLALNQHCVENPALPYSEKLSFFCFIQVCSKKTCVSYFTAFDKRKETWPRSTGLDQLT